MNDLVQRMVALAHDIDVALGRPLVERFHYPVDAAPKSLRGDFCVMQLAGGGSGLSYSLGDAQGVDGGRLPLAGERVWDWAERFADGRVVGPARAAGLAAINALYAALLDRCALALPGANSSFGISEPSEGEHIGMIGFFPPLVKRLRGAAGVSLTVIELRRELERDHGVFKVSTDPGLLADCDKVLCTSTTLLNGTLADMRDRAVNAREFALLGPSAGCPPDALFEMGITALAGAQVADERRLWKRLTGGESLGDARRKTVVHAGDVPPVAAMIESLPVAGPA